MIKVLKNDMLKRFTEKQLETLRDAVETELLFRVSQRKRKEFEKSGLPSLQKLFAKLTEGELQSILED